MVYIWNDCVTADTVINLLLCHINAEECVLYQISIYAVPEKIDQTAYALDAAVKLLDFYDDYFDIPYPLPKQG